MEDDTTISPLHQPGSVIGPLTEIAHDGARQMLPAALRAEAASFVAQFAEERLPKAIAYMFKTDRWEAFTRFLDDGRICLTNNAAERALHSVALGRKSWLFAGSERGGDHAAFIYPLIVTAKMNDIDPQTWLADVLGRLPDITASQVPALLSWNWRALEHRQAA